MYTRTLLFVGLFLLLVPIVALALILLQSFPKQTLTSQLVSQTPASVGIPTPSGPETPTVTPSPTSKVVSPMETRTPTKAPSTPTPISTPLLPVTGGEVQPELLPTGVVEVEWPVRMEIERSDSIRVSLIQTEDRALVPTVEIVRHAVETATLIPVGTPAVPIERAFGLDYQAFAVATLAATSFEERPVIVEEQSLGQKSITWEWNITPKNPGRQFVNVSIEVRWQPISSGEAIRRQIWRTQLDIQVDKPLITLGQLNVLALASGSLGSGLSIPWLRERIKEARARRQAVKRKPTGRARRRKQ